MSQCHICGKNAETDIEKCKLCCDGFEHEFCPDCARDYRTYRAKFMTQEGDRAFALLRGRRARHIASFGQGGVA